MVIMMSLSSLPMSSLSTFHPIIIPYSTKSACHFLNLWVLRRNDAITTTVQFADLLLNHRKKVFTAAEEPSQTSPHPSNRWACSWGETSSMSFHSLLNLVFRFLPDDDFCECSRSEFRYLCKWSTLSIENEFTQPIGRMILSECLIKQFQPCACA